FLVDRMSGMHRGNAKAERSKRKIRRRTRCGFSCLDLRTDRKGQTLPVARTVRLPCRGRCRRGDEEIRFLRISEKYRDRTRWKDRLLAKPRSRLGQIRIRYPRRIAKGSI